MPRRGGLAAAPDGAGIAEDFKPAITIVHRIVNHAIAAYRVDVEPVPPSQGRRVAQDEALKQRRLPRDAACGYFVVHLVIAALEVVTGLGEVANVDEIAIQGTSGGPQAVICIHLVLVGIGVLHLAMITE